MKYVSVNVKIVIHAKMIIAKILPHVLVNSKYLKS